MKKILFVCFVFLFIFIIYLTNIDKKVYYLALGDIRNYSLYVKKYLAENDILEKEVFEFSDSKDRITDIYNKIISNIKIGDKTIKNSLIKADLVTLKINNIDIYEKINDSSFNDVYDYIDELTLDFEKLLVLIRKYCKEKIVFIGFKYQDENENEKDLIDYLNKRFKEACDENHIIYLIESNDLRNNIIREINKNIIES